MADAGVRFWIAQYAWVVIAYGLTLLITGSKIFEPLRRRIDRFDEFLGFGIHCPMCVGFWIGLALSARYGLGPSIALGGVSGLEATHRGERILLDGFAASGMCWTVHVVLAKLGAEDL